MTDGAWTELALTGGERLRVVGDPRAVESVVIAAARGSIMELAWLTEADTGREIGVNPEHVLTLRALDGRPGGAVPQVQVPGSQSV